MAQQTVVTNVSIRVRRNSSRDRDKPKRARCQEGRNYRVWPAPSIRATNCLDRVSFEAQYSFLLFGPIRFSRFIFFFFIYTANQLNSFFQGRQSIEVNIANSAPRKAVPAQLAFFFACYVFLLRILYLLLFFKDY